MKKFKAMILMSWTHKPNYFCIIQLIKMMIFLILALEKAWRLQIHILKIVFRLYKNFKHT